MSTDGAGATEGNLGHGRHLAVVAVSDTVRDTPGLFQLLAREPSISVIHCSRTGNEAVDACKRLQPCIFIVDTSFLDNVEVAQVARPEFGRSIKMLVVTDDDNPVLHNGLLRMGCAGIVPRGASADVYQKALQSVAEGEIWASRKAVASLVREMLREDSPRKLTSREKEILSLIAKGYQNRKVADSLFISRETVRWHVRSIYSKLGVRDRDFAVAQALASGEIVPEKMPAGAEVGQVKKLSFG